MYLSKIFSVKDCALFMAFGFLVHLIVQIQIWSVNTLEASLLSWKSISHQ